MWLSCDLLRLSVNDELARLEVRLETMADGLTALLSELELLLGLHLGPIGVDPD